MISTDNFQISESLGKAVEPDIAWSGSNYGVVWNDSRSEGESEIYFMKLNELGGKTIKELKVSNDANRISDNPAIAWAGNLYGIVWPEYYREASKNKDGCNLYLNRVDKDGNLHGGIISVTSDNYGSCPSRPAVVWTGSAYGIVWHETTLNNNTSTVFFIKLNPLADRITNEIPVSETANSENASIVWTGSDYGLVWQASRNIYFAGLDINGKRQWGDIKINGLSHNTSNPKIAWYDSYYAVAWQGYDNEGIQQIYFAKLDHNGKKIGDEIAITDNKDDDYSINPSIIWYNSEYIIVWQQGASAVDFVSVDADGTKKSKILRVSENASGETLKPVIALGTSQYGFVWSGTHSGGNEIYFARVGFSDIAKINQQSFLAFIEKLYSNNWLIIILGLLLIIFLCMVVNRVKGK